jgi:hypothetical protein
MHAADTFEQARSIWETPGKYKSPGELEEGYPQTDRQIKVWHYCDGFGTLNLDGMKNLMNCWIKDGFNEETKKFFKEECDCGDFFDGEFTL